MVKAYVYGDTPTSAGELVAYAKGIGLAVTVLALDDPEGFLSIGADSAIVLKGGASRPEAYAAAIADVVADDREAVLLVSSTASGREIAATAAGKLECAMLSDVSSLAVEGDVVKAERTVLGGAVIDSCEAALPCVVTMGAGMADVAASAQTADVRERVVEPDVRVRRLSLEPTPTGSVDLAKADIVICVGMGIDGPEDVAMAQRLADDVGGALACTRDVAEGAKLVPKEQYIGITGQVVKPSLYLSMGVSGQVQHVYGMRGSKVVVAVNNDKSAPIFKAADYGVLGDLHEVMPKIIEAVENS